MAVDMRHTNHDITVVNIELLQAQDYGAGHKVPEHEAGGDRTGEDLATGTETS